MRTQYCINRSPDCGSDSLDVLRQLSKKTRKIVIISNIAEKMRKMISGSSARRLISLRSSRLKKSPCLRAFCRGVVMVNGFGRLLPVSSTSPDRSSRLEMSLPHSMRCAQHRWC